MSAVPNTVEGIKAKIDALKKQGKTESTSKEVGKLVNALKVLTPAKYGAKQVESAKQSLKSNTTDATKQFLGIGGDSGETITSLAGGGTGLNTLSGGGSGSSSLQGIYDTALSNAGVSELEKQLQEKQRARDAALADINDNPFYTEATRVGKISKLNQASENDINTLSDQIKSAKADAQVRLSIANQQFNIDDKLYQRNIQKLNTLISTGAINNASSDEISQIARATGLTTSMIKSIQKQATANKKTQVNTSTDDNGNVTISVFDPATGAVIAQNSLGQIAKTSKSTGSGTGSKITDKDVGVALSIIANDVVSENPTDMGDKFLSKAEIQDAYNMLLQKYGNSETALTLLEKAMNAGGYSEWEG